MDLKKLNVKTNQSLCNSDFKMEVDTDIIVPDVKPDVIKVINVSAMPTVKEQYAQKGKVTISGNVFYRIMYVGDNDEYAARSIEYNAPFSQQFDMPCATENAQIFAIPTLTNITNSIQNSRKINVKSYYNVKIFMPETTENDIIIDLNENEFLPFRSTTVNATNKAISQNDDIEMGESIEISENIFEILNTTCSASANDIKVVNNKVIIKGRVSSKIIYITNENVVKTYDYKEEFSDVIDVLGITPEMQTNVNLFVKECDIRLISNSDETSSTIALKITIEAVTEAYESNEFNGIYDIYSPDYNIETTYDNIGYLTLVLNESKQNTVTDIAEVKNNAIDDILSSDANCVIKSKAYSDGKITVDALIMANVIYLADGKMNTVKKDIPAQFYFDINNDISDIKINPYIRINDIIAAQKGSNQIEIKVPVMCEVMVFSANNKSFLTDVNYNEENKIDKSNQPSIIVYVVNEGDSLWKIAKKYNSTVEEIMSLNNLTTDEIIPGKKLIIPKRR